MGIRRCPYCRSYAVARSRRTGLVERLPLPQVLLRPFRRLTYYQRHYRFVLARRGSPKARQSKIARAGVAWIAQYAHLLALSLCVPVVLTGTRVRPWGLPPQCPSGPEIRSEAGKTDKPVVRTTMPVALGPQREVLEFHDISDTKHTSTEGGIREPNESKLANFGAQQASRRPLGALGAKGEVYINNSPAPSDSTIFVGDMVRTGDRGLATFTMSGQGSIGINPNTEVSFVDDPQYIATLHRGALMIHFFTGATRFRLRVLNYFVAGQRGSEAAAEITQTAETAATVNCRSGSVAVAELQGREVSSLQAGQFLEIENVEGRAAAPQAPAPLPTSPPEEKKGHRTAWIVVGLAGGGGAAGAAAALASGGGRKTVSPSSP